MPRDDPVTVTVPVLTGLTVSEARAVGHRTGVVVVSADLDGPPLDLGTSGRTLVIAQHPPAGLQVEWGDAVEIEWIDLGGGGGPDGGDREPRVPPPSPRSLWASAPAGDEGDLVS